MTYQNIIILTDGEHFETWGSLKELCKEHGFSYHYLKDKPFPILYKKKYRLIKTPFRQKNGVES